MTEQETLRMTFKNRSDERYYLHRVVKVNTAKGFYFTCQRLVEETRMFKPPFYEWQFFGHLLGGNIETESEDEARRHCAILNGIIPKIEVI